MIPAAGMDVMEEIVVTEYQVLAGFQAEMDKTVVMDSLVFQVFQEEMDEMVVMECQVLRVLLAEMVRVDQLDHRDSLDLAMGGSLM